MLHLLELVALRGAAVPGGHQLLEPGIVAALPWLGGARSRPLDHGRAQHPARGGRRAGWASTAVLWVALGAGALPGAGDGGTSLALHFLDVGQGDARRDPHARRGTGS